MNPKKIILIPFLLMLLASVPSAIYYYKFGSSNLSSHFKDWVDFANYFTGVITPIMATISAIFLYYTWRNTKQELELATYRAYEGLINSQIENINSFGEELFSSKETATINDQTEQLFLEEIYTNAISIIRLYQYYFRSARYGEHKELTNIPISHVKFSSLKKLFLPICKTLNRIDQQSAYKSFIQLYVFSNIRIEILLTALFVYHKNLLSCDTYEGKIADFEICKQELISLIKYGESEEKIKQYISDRELIQLFQFK